jgi:hypothetical protein
MRAIGRAPCHDPAGCLNQPVMSDINHIAITGATRAGCAA